MKPIIMRFIAYLLNKNQSSQASGKVQLRVSEKLIAEAFKRRAKEIESLRKYDRGEKKIDAPALRDFVQNL